MLIFVKHINSNKVPRLGWLGHSTIWFSQPWSLEIQSLYGEVQVRALLGLHPIDLSLCPCLQKKAFSNLCSVFLRRLHTSPTQSDHLSSTRYHHHTGSQDFNRHTWGWGNSQTFWTYTALLVSSSQLLLYWGKITEVWGKHGAAN